MITHLEPGQIFVFGSNQAGIHGAGAARYALDNFGAQYGVGYGHTGYCFAIPTKDRNINTLPLDEIRHYVKCFLSEARQHPEFQYLVTAIGCGLAGYKPSDIAPLFRGHSKNVVLPEEFKKI